MNLGKRSRDELDDSLPMIKKRTIRCSLCREVGHNARSCPDRNYDRVQRGSNSSSSLQPAKAVAIQSIEGEDELSTVSETDQEPDDYDEERMRIDEEENSPDDTENEDDWETVTLHSESRENIEFASPKGVNRELIDERSPQGITDYFGLLMTDQIMETFVQATNAYAADGRVKNWQKDVTLSELKAFFGILLFLGIVKFPNRRIAFRDKIFGSFYLQKLMSYERFSQLLRALHYLDYSEFTSAQLSKEKEANPFFPVEGLCTDLQIQFQAFYRIHQAIDIDEQTIPWKGRHACRCYIAKKPDKWHFKIFSLNDSTNGYMSKFYLYKGKQEERPADVSASLWPYKQLIDGEFQNKNHILATDNWFTSIESISYILSTGNHLVGTVRKNRKHIPKRQMLKKNTPRGTTTQSTRFINGKNIYFTSWMDTKDVYFLSTFPGSLTTTARRSYNRITKRWEKKQIKAPTIASLYNKIMCGTDSCDHRLSLYRPQVKSKSWIPRVIIHFLTITAFNSYIIYKEYKNLPKYNYLNYLMDLFIELIREERESKTSPLEPGSQPPTKNTKTMWEKNPFRWTGSHIPVTTNKEEKTRRRGRCIICNSRCSTLCKICGIYLCIKTKDLGQKNHWERFHSRESLMNIQQNDEESSGINSTDSADSLAEDDVER